MKTLPKLSAKHDPTTYTHPEAELLLCCARTDIHSEAEQIKALLKEKINWDYLLRTALWHGMAALLYCSLNATCPEAVPKPILDQLRYYFHNLARRNLFLTRELLKLLNLFQAHEIPAIPYKGPVLAASAYGNLALRQFCDLDILIHRQDALKVKSLLLNQGYRLSQEQPSGAQEAMWFKSACEYNFVSNDGKVMVEPHWAIARPKYCFLLDPECLWQRLETISLAGTPVLTFQPEDMLLIVCMNGTKDHWQSLKQICDVAEVIRAHQEIDWERVIKQASILGSERMLKLSLFLASDLLGTALPEKVWQRIQADPVVKSLATQVRERLFVNATNSPKFEDSNFSLWDIRVRERLQDRVRYCFTLVFMPNEGDAALLPLPPSLYFIYYLLRPIRLIGRNGLMVLKHILGLLNSNFSITRRAT